MSWVPPAPVGQPGYSSSPPSNTSRPSREPGPARGMSSSTTGGGSSSMREGPSAGAVAMPSPSSRPSAGSDAGAGSPPQAFRRPARSMRRPNALSQTGIPQLHQQQQQQGDAPPPSPLDDRSQGNAQQAWEDDRAHREIARAAGTAPADSDSQVFKTALMTKAFQSAARDGKAARTTPSRRGTADELADDDDGLSEGEFAAIGTVLREIKRDWRFMVEPNFNPVPLALELVDPSSNSQRTLPQFNALSCSLLGALQQTVNKHSSSFASAISTHNAFLNSLSAAQAEVREARATLVAAKEQLGGERKAEVGALYARGRVLKEMIAVLDTIEHLKAVPDHLDALVAEKRLLLASLVLVRALKTINKPEMLEIGALADLRSYLVNQETILKDILVEELHNHLYLKSYYSGSRWKPYIRGQTTFSDPSSATSSLPFSLPSNIIASATPIASTRASSALPTGRNSPAPNNRPPASPTNPAGAGASSTSPTGSTATPAKLALYLEDLAMRPSQDPLLDIPDALDVLLPAISATTSSSSTLASSSAPASAARLLPVKLTASTNTSPEADSFGFIEHLVEALAALGRLGWALETLAQRQSAEVFALVEATVAEVEERAADRRRHNLAPTGAATGMAPPPPPSSTTIGSSAAVAGGSTLGSMAAGIGVSGEAAAAAIGDATVLVGALHALDYSSNVDERAETLRDLFWTTYAKLDAVLQGLRVAWEVAGWIAGRKDFRDAPPSITTGGAPSAVASAPISASSTMQHKASGGGSAVAIAADVVEIWKPIQAEVRTLLRDYLTSEDSGLASTRNPIASVNDVLRDGKTQRDRTKNVFRFVDSDAKVNARLVKMYDEDLLRSLRSSVPGLVGLDPASTAVSADDRLSLAATSPAAATTTQHRTVVPPDAFNVPILFQPTLAFLARASAVMPIGFNEDETSGLDEFVVKVYLPRLEEKVSDLFVQATRAPSAFQEDPLWRTLTLRPVIKASVQVLALITNLCAMLRTTPFHRENYSRLIISIIIQFYQRCSGHFTEVVSRHSSSGGADGATSHLSLSGLWAQRVELTACMEELNRTSEDKPGRLRELGLQETRLELALKNEQVIEEDKLLASTRKFGQLGNLYMSLIWTMARLRELKGSADDTASGLVSPPATTLTFETGLPPPSLMDRAAGGRDTVPEGGPQLPLTHAMAQRFEALLETYKQLSEMVLFTMRIEIRCRVMHFMDLAMRGNYRLEQEAFEPDPNVIDLIADLERFEEVAEATLPPRERSFVLRGLGPLVDDLLVSNSRHVRFANEFGVRKIMRNVLALQQSLKTIADDPSEADFLRGRAYWHLFFEGPKPMLDGLRLKGTTTTPPGTRGFSFEEYRAMLSLQLGVEQGPGASRGVGAKGGGETTTTKPAPTSDKERRQYNEYLVSLMEVVRDE